MAINHECLIKKVQSLLLHVNYDERIYKFTEAVTLYLQKGVTMNYVMNMTSSICNINNFHAW